jgi:OOP family OmpA-OmpF porin
MKRITVLFTLMGLFTLSHHAYAESLLQHTLLDNTVSKQTERYHDLDQDGVSDRKDQCPNSKAGAAVNAYGCHSYKPSKKLSKILALNPSKAPSLPKIIETPELNTLLFEFDSIEFKADQAAKLEENIRLMEKHLQDDQKLLLTSHTCDMGEESYNLALSEKRAAVTKAYLENALPNLKGRIWTLAEGERSLLSTLFDRISRQQNRRIEFEILNANQALPKDAKN